MDRSPNSSAVLLYYQWTFIVEFLALADFTKLVEHK